MTPHDLLHSKKEWQDKVALISYQHHKMLIKTHGKWTVKDTALYFEISIGFTSENLQLAEHLDRLKVFKTRKAALTVLRINGS